MFQEKQLKAQIVDLQTSLIQEREAFEAEQEAHALEVAGLNGQIALLRETERKYQGLLLGHVFHYGGSVELQGQPYKLMEAHTDIPLAKARYLVPEGQIFP